MESIHASMYRSGLIRATSDKVVAGVCSGVARKLGVDAGIARLIFVLLVLLPGSSVVAYIVLWICMPGEDYRPIGWTDEPS